MRVAVIGAASIDRYLMLDSFPERDSMVFAKGVHEFVGGSGANIALNLSRRFETDFYFGTGSDSTSELILKRLSSTNLNLRYNIENGPGATTLVMIDSHAERRIISLGGHALFSGITDPAEYNVLCVADSYREVAINAFKNNVKSLKIYVPGGCGLYFGVDSIIEVSSFSDFLVLSESEARILGKKINEISTNRIITRGSSETILIDKNQNSHSFEVEKVGSRIVDTTGAGDAFAAGFIEKYIESGDVVRSICYGHKKAAEVISITGPNLIEGGKDLE